MTNNPQNPNHQVWDVAKENSMIPDTTKFLPNDPIKSADTNYLYNQDSNFIDFLIKNGIPSYQTFSDGYKYVRGSIVKWYEDIFVATQDNVTTPPIINNVIDNNNWILLRDVYKTPLVVTTIEDKITYTLISVKSYLGLGEQSYKDDYLYEVSTLGIDMNVTYHSSVKVKIDDLEEVDISFSLNNVQFNKMELFKSGSNFYFKTDINNEVFYSSDISTDSSVYVLSNPKIKQYTNGMRIRFKPKYNILSTTVGANINNLGVINILRSGGAQLFGSEIQKNKEVELIYNDNTFLLQNIQSSDLKIGEFAIEDTKKFTSEEQLGFILFDNTEQDLTQTLTNTQKSNIQNMNSRASFFKSDQLDIGNFVTRSDVYNRYLRGGTSYGAVGEQGLPEIEGTIRYASFYSTTYKADGPLKFSASFNNIGYGSSVSNGSFNGGDFEFKASDSNSIYGASVNVETQNIAKPIYLFVGLV